MRTILAVVLVGALTTLVGTAAWTDEAPSDELVVGLADNATDHAAVAAFFRQKAQRAREIAIMHRRMAQNFVARELRERETMKKHCELLAAREDEVAAQYDLLAAAHEAEAK